MKLSAFGHLTAGRNRRAVFLVAAIFSLDAQSRYAKQSTQLGDIECRLRDLPNVLFATASVYPGESLFVYPYQPIWYSLTGGVNPTSYDFLQPGMMTLADESRVLHELEANPPDWVIWHNLSPRVVFSIWPHSDPATLHFNRIESYIRSHYAQLKPPDPSHKYAIAIFNRIGSQRN